MAHIAVIGAGPCGILATKLLLERGFKVTLFESGNMHEEVHITQSDYNFDSPSKLPVDVHKVGGGSNANPAYRMRLRVVYSNIK